MGRWLKRIAKTPASVPPKPTELGLVSFGSTDPGLSQNIEKLPVSQMVGSARVVLSASETLRRVSRAGCWLVVERQELVLVKPAVIVLHGTLAGQVKHHCQALAEMVRAGADIGPPVMLNGKGGA